MKEKRERKKGKSLFSLSTLLASFFGAAMIAGAFAYFNYKFSEYKFINFQDWVFYEKNNVFQPNAKRYLVVFYSSRKKNDLEIIRSLHVTYPVIAIDYYAKKIPSTNKVHYLYSGTNTLLKFIQRFNIYEAPTVFLIKQEKDLLYKQDSMIHKLKNLQDLESQISSL